MTPPKTRDIHQYTYFYHNLEDFIAKGTLYQLQSYVDKYTPVIEASIRSAAAMPPTNDNNHSTTAEEIYEPLSIHIPPPVTMEVLPTLDQSLVHPALEEAPHRKCNRRRTKVSEKNRITNYFGRSGP